MVVIHWPVQMAKKTKFLGKNLNQENTLSIKQLSRHRFLSSLFHHSVKDSMCTGIEYLNTLQMCLCVNWSIFLFTTNDFLQSPSLCMKVDRCQSDLGWPIYWFIYYSAFSIQIQTIPNNLLIILRNFLKFISNHIDTPLLTWFLCIILAYMSVSCYLLVIW